MGTHITNSALYGHQWSTPETNRLFEDENRVRSWLHILTALAAAQAEVGLIPEDAAQDIAAYARIESMDLPKMAELTRRTGHSSLGLIRCLRDVLPPSAAEWVYYGATVQDLSDTWAALVMRDMASIMDQKLGHLVNAATALAEKHRGTVMCGRTHGQPGLPISFGFKAAVWAAELARHRERLNQARRRFEVVQLGGALGTMEFWGERSVRLLGGFARKLGLGVPDVAWITARDGVAEFFGLLAMATSTLAKIGQEVYTLQRPEIGELHEPWPPGQVGSITMPHKRNPELAEQLVTLAKVVRSNSALVTEGMVHEHERDGRAWKTEWLAFPEACMLTGVSLSSACVLLDQLEVDTHRMQSNVDACNGYLMSESVMRVLAERIGKHSAHEVIYQTARAGHEQGWSLRTALLNEPGVAKHLSVEEIDRSLDPTAAIAACGVFIDRVLSAVSRGVVPAGGAR